MATDSRHKDISHLHLDFARSPTRPDLVFKFGRTAPYTPKHKLWSSLFLWRRGKQSNNASRSGWSVRQCQTSTNNHARSFSGPSCQVHGMPFERFLQQLRSSLPRIHWVSVVTLICMPYVDSYSHVIYLFIYIIHIYYLFTLSNHPDRIAQLNSYQKIDTITKINKYLMTTYCSDTTKE